MNEPRPLDDEEASRLARRKLLRIGAYAAPVLLGVFSVNRAEAASCMPSTPCGPDNPCGPAGCMPGT